MKKIHLQEPLIISNIINCAKVLQEEMAGNANELSLDLRDVEDCDTSGVQLIISAYKSASNKNQKIVLEGMSDAVNAAFICAGIDDANNYLSSEL